MKKNILVAYASKHGATAEIAEKIGAVLRENDLAADVRPVAKVDDLRSYAAVILGSGVYIGKWRKEAAKFLLAFEKELAQQPVWFFSSGPTGTGDPVALLQGWKFPKELNKVADRIGPRDTAVFGGRLNAKDLNFLEKRMTRMVKAPLGDFRDWPSIVSWAVSIARELEKERKSS